MPTLAAEESWSEQVKALRGRVFKSDAGAVTGVAEDLHALLLRMADDALATDDASEADCVAYLMGIDTLMRLPPTLRPRGFDAVAELERAEAIAAARLDDPTYSAHVAWQLGQALRDVGALDRAMQTYLDAAEREPAAVTMRPSLFIAASQLSIHRGAFVEAMEQLDRAAAAVDVIQGEWRDRDSVRCSIASFRAEALMTLGLPDRAAPYVEEERGLAEASGRDALIAASFLRRADFLLATERFETLDGFVEEVIEDEALKLRPDTVLTLQLRQALGLAELGRFEPASSAHACELFEQLLPREGLLDVHRVRIHASLAQLALREGEVSVAREWLDRARARLDDLRAADPSGFGPLEDGAFVAALDAAVALAEPRDPRALAEQLVRSEADLRRFLDRWAEAPSREGGVGFLHYGKRRWMLSELIRLSLAVHEGEAGVLRALEIVHRVQAMGSTARARDYVPGPFAEVRRLLTGPDRGLVVYLPAPDRGHVFAIDARRVVHAETPPLDPLDDARRELMIALDRAARATDGPARTAWEPRAAGLAADLLPPDIERLIAGWSSVTIVGRSLLGDLPFELLPLPSGARLGRAKALSYLPSLPVGVELAGRARPLDRSYATDLFAIVAPDVDPRVAAEWPTAGPIPFRAEELERLTGPFGERSVVRSGVDASRAALRDERLGTSRVLLVLAHGVYDPAEGRGAALLLAGADGPTSARDLEGVAVPPLVVLLACGAGRGPLRRGDDGVDRLGESFLRRGAVAVLVAETDLELAAVTELTAVFMERLAGYGDTPAEALRVAREHLARESRTSEGRALVHVLGLGGVAVFPER